MASVAATALAAPGALDPTFSADGKLVFDLEEGRADAVSLDGSGRIVAAGQVDPPGGDNNDFAVARFLRNGAPDTSFSGDGLATVDAGVAGDANDSNGVVVDAAGRIYVAGGEGGADGDFAVARFLDNGDLDLPYGGGDGVATLDLGDTGDVVEAIRIDASGRAVVAGVSDDDFAVARFTTTGDPDTTFGAPDGFQTLNIGLFASDDRGQALAIDSSNRIVVAGQTGAINVESFAFARFTASGELDTAFSTSGSDGRGVVDMTGIGERDFGHEVEIASGDRPVIGGPAESPTGPDEFALLRLTSVGEIDTSFSGDGRVLAGFGEADDVLDGLDLDRSGRIVAGGVTYPGLGPGAFAAMRFLPSGALDPSFSGDGKASADIGPGDDFGQAAVVDSSDRLVVSGYNGDFADADFALARFEGAPRCGGRVPTIVGTSGKDKLRGTKRADVIFGGPGNDTIRGLAGRDRLCGDLGRDRLIGGKGADRLFGGKGRDRLLGGPGRDRLRGGPGSDRQRQ